jgi:hypothetical protein
VEQAEFDALRAFIKTVWDFAALGAVASEGQQIGGTIDAMKETLAPSAALKGIREAANDMVEMTKDLAGADLKRLEVLLREAGAPSLESMLFRRYRQVMVLLARKEIRTEEECRLLQGELGDVEDTSLLRGELRDLAERLVDGYEPRDE